MKFLNKIKELKNHFPVETIMLVIFGILFFAVFFKFFYFLSIPGVDDLFNKKETAKLYPSQYVFQKIVAEEDNFDQIFVAFRDVDYHPRDEFTMEITDGDYCQDVVRKAQANFLLYWPAYTSIKFPKIEDSAGKKYCIKFMFNPKSKRERDLPRIYVSTGPESQGFQYINEGEEHDSDLGIAVYKNRRLMIRPAYDYGFWGNMKNLTERMSQYKPWFLKGYYLFILMFLTVFLLIFVVFGIILL